MEACRFSLYSACGFACFGGVEIKPPDTWCSDVPVKDCTSRYFQDPWVDGDMVLRRCQLAGEEGAWGTSCKASPDKYYCLHAGPPPIESPSPPPPPSLPALTPVELECYTQQHDDVYTSFCSSGVSKADDCADEAPDNHYTCEQQQYWGKCDDDWMWGKCCKTCGKCGKADTGCPVVGATQTFSVEACRWAEIEQHWRDTGSNQQELTGCEARKPVAGTVMAGPLTGAMCSAMLHDPTHLFRRMWAAEAWGKMQSGAPACWERERDASDMWLQDGVYFREAAEGVDCRSNWYEGNYGKLGQPDSLPTFGDQDADAPALLGFDEDIDGFCWQEGCESHAQCCIDKNLNILSLYGTRVPYNLCRNLEWMLCAANGRLPGQVYPTLMFARAPKDLAPDGSTGKPLGQCGGWVPNKRPEGGVFGYATEDVFYLEVCMYHHVCSNGDELFELNRGDKFSCKFSQSAFEELEQMLMSPLAPEPADAVQCKGSRKGGFKAPPKPVEKSDPKPVAEVINVPVAKVAKAAEGGGVVPGTHGCAGWCNPKYAPNHCKHGDCRACSFCND